MAEPKKRLTSTRSGNRQSKDALKSNALIICSNCKTKILPHRVCKNCGYYKGEKILKLKEEVKKIKKTQEQLEETKNE
jgi:large subunit ribosomal protein L32